MRNLYGTVYDYWYDGSEWQPKTKPHLNNPTEMLPDYDSADSYAATFISLLRAHVQSGGKTEILHRFSHQVETIAGLMIVLMDKSDHLTIAKPNLPGVRLPHPVKFLMDNCEVYRGLDDAAWLFEHVFSDLAKARHFQSWATESREGILSNLAYENQFYVSKTLDDDDQVVLNGVNWQVWYGDMVSQLFPVALGVIPASDNRVLYAYERLREHHPSWSVLDAVPSLRDFPWAFMAYAMARIGQFGELNAFKESAEKTYIEVTSRDTWKWHPAEAGWLVLACRHADTVPAPW